MQKGKCMDITPNYNLNFLRFNQKIRNNIEQTEPTELKQPAFKMSAKNILSIQKTREKMQKFL